MASIFSNVYFEPKFSFNFPKAISFFSNDKLCISIVIPSKIPLTILGFYAIFFFVENFESSPLIELNPYEYSG